MVHRVTSVNGISIRLTNERWLHITEEHCELAGLLHDVLDAIVAPEKVLVGNEGELLAVKETGDIPLVARLVLNSPYKYLWSSYDDEADVLYINFKKPAVATDSELTDDDVIIRYEGDEIIGLTVLHANNRTK